jgi:hypothetical protein
MSPSTTGARSASGRKRKPLGWLPWVLLLLLALVIAVVVLIVANTADDDGDGTGRGAADAIAVSNPSTNHHPLEYINHV